MHAEYIAKIRGDISALDKTIKEAQGKIKRLNDDEVLIKFDYDGNAKQFNKVFQSIIQKHPELTIQLQYDLNKKFLAQKMSELRELETLKMKMDPSDIEGELTDVNKKIENTRASIEIINDELKRLSSSNHNLELGKQLSSAQTEAKETAESFEKVESSVTETRKSLGGLYDNFKQFFQLKGGHDVSVFWDRLKYAIDAGDQELKELLADWKLLNDEGSLSPITNGGVNSGGAIGTENVLIARTNSKDKEGRSLYSRTNELKKSLDEAYASGVSVARILDIIGDEKSEVFFEVQSKAVGNTLGSYGLTNDNIPSINPEFLQATDEQVNKLYQDIKKLNDLGVGVDINPENIMYDKEKGFSLIDLDLKPATYKDQAEMIEDILSGTVRTIHDFYEDLGDSAGMSAAQQFEDKMLSVAKSFEEIDQAANKSIKSTQQSNSPSKEGKARGNDLGEGYVEGIRESIPEVEKAASDMTQAALDAVSGSSDKASTIKDFFSLYGDVSTALNNGVAANLDEFKSIFGDLFSKDISDLSEKEINVQFAKDLLQQLDLSEDKLAVVKSLLQDIENIQPGGVAEKAVTDTQRAAIILEDVEKIFKIANGTYIISEEDVRNANEILKASQKGTGNNSTNNPYESIESYSREAEQAVSAVTDNIREEGIAAAESAKQKEDFAKANEHVAESAQESAESTKKESDAISDNTETVKENTTAKKDSPDQQWIRHDLKDNKGNTYTAALSQVEDKRVTPKGVSYYVDMDKLAKKIKDTWTEIYELEYKIRTTEGDNSGNLQNLALLNEQKDVYNQILEKVINSPLYVADQSQKDILNAQLALNEEQIKNKQIQSEATKAEKERAKALLDAQKQADALNKSAISNSNKLYSDVEKNLKEITNLEIENVWADPNSAEATNKILINQRKINELKAENVRIQQEINAADAVQQNKESEILELQNKLDQSLLDAQSKRIGRDYDKAAAEDSKEIASLYTRRVKNEEALYNLKKQTIGLNSSDEEDHIKLVSIARQRNALSQENVNIIKRLNEINGVNVAQENKLSDARTEYNKKLKESAQLNELQLKKKTSPNIEKEDAASSKLNLDKEYRLTALNKYYEELSGLGLLSNEVKLKFDSLYSMLDSADTSGLQIYDKEIRNLKQSMDATVASAKALQNASNPIDTLIAKLNVLNNEDKYIPEFIDRVNEKLAELNRLKDAYGDGQITDEEDVNRLNEIVKDIEKLNADSKIDAFKNIKELSKSKILKQISDYLSKYTGLSKNTRKEIEAIGDAIEKVDNPKALRDLYDEFVRLQIGAKKAGEETESTLSVINRRLTDMDSKFIAQFLSWQDLIRYVREVANTVRELDTALTEMRKVSDESIEALKSFQNASFGIADEVGTTALQIQNSTADFMRLGETLEDAKESARVANVLFNVSEFESIDEATSSLIAMSAAYKDLEKIDIVDKLNKIGNDYSISTDGIATALQDSASALVTAYNDIDEAIALITAGNAVVQDPDKVGNGLRTIALRLTGTKEASEALQELGEETDGMITTQSKLRETIMDATRAASKDGKGFDILDNNGNYKSTYEIMLGLAELYDDIVEADKRLGTNNLNLLLETIAGKNRANIAASILQNPDTLKRAFDDSAVNSTNSALEENQKYLESIEGHIAKFQNATQELFYELVDSGTVNSALDLATDFVNLLTRVVELLGDKGTLAALGSLLALLKASEHGYGPKKVGSLLSGLLSDLRKTGNAAQTAEIFLGETEGAINAVGTASSKSSKLVGLLNVALNGLKAHPLIAVFSAIAVGGVVAFNKITTSVKESQEKMAETESDIASLNAKIKKLRDSDSLTYSQQKYLEALEKELAIKERILELDKQESARQTYKYTFAEAFDPDNEYRQYLLKRQGRETPTLSGGTVYSAHESGIKISVDLKTLEEYRSEMEKLDLNTAEGVKKYDEYQRKIDAITRKHSSNLSDVYQDVQELQTAVDKAQSAIDNHDIEAGSQEYENAQQIIKAYSKMIAADQSVIDAYERLTTPKVSAISPDRVTTPVLNGLQTATDSVMDKLKKGDSELFTNSSINGYLETLYAVSDALENGTELTEDQLTELRKYFGQLEDQFPQLKDDIIILNEEFLQGTNVWADAIANVKKAITELKFDKVGDKFEEAIQKFEIPEIKTEVSDKELTDFESRLNGLIESDKDISITVHADISDNISTISDMFNDINTAAATVQKNFKVSFNDLEGLSAIFPGILEGMTVLKDGSVQLDKEMAQSAIDAARAEADADAESAMDRLNTQATLLEQKANTYKQMAEAAAVLAGNEVDSAMTSEEAQAQISAGLAEIKQINAQLTANEEQEQQKNVADSSQKNGQVVAQNWAGAWQDALNNAVDFANGAVQAQDNVANGIKTGELKVRGSSFSGSTGTSNETNLLAETKSALEDNATNVQQIYQDLQTRYLEAAAVAEKAAGAARDGIQLIKANRQFTDYNLNQVKSGKAGRTTPESLDSSNGSGSDKAEEYKELIDYFERLIKTLDNSIDLLEAHLEDVVGSFAKNTLLSAQEDLIKQKMDGYASAIDMYSQKASEALSKIPSDIADKVVNGAVAIDEFVGEGNEEVVDAINDYEQWADKVADCKLQLVELKEAIRQLELQKFNNIVEDFTNQFDLRQSAGIDLISKQIELLQEAGQLVGESFYQHQIDQATKQIAILQNEQKALVSQMEEALSNGIDTGSEEWLEMVNALTDVEGSILDAKKAVEEFDNALLELHTEIFNRIQDQFSSFANELSNMQELIADDALPVATVKNQWTDEGLAQLGLLAQQYEMAQYQVAQYNEEIERLNQLYLEGRYSSTEYADKLIELKSAQWDAVNASEAALQSIRDLNEARVNIVIEGINEEIDAYSELIQKQKDALQAESDLHEYRKQIADESKSIVDIQRQLAAIADDDSAAAAAKRAKLQEQLAEAQEALEETEYDHSISAQQDALDAQLEQYQETRQAEIDALNESLLNVEQILYDSFEAVRANSELIGQTIVAQAQAHGIEMSTALTDAWFQGENAIAHYGEVLTAGTSNFIGQIQGVEYQVYELQNQTNVTSESLASMFATRADNLVDELVRSYMSEDNLNALTQALGDSLTNTIDGSYSGSSAQSALNGIAEAANGVAEAANNAASALRSMMDAQNAAQETYTGKIYQQGSDGDYYYAGTGTVSGSNVWEKNGRIYVDNGYAKGTKGVKENQLAWTQENGAEMIISPSTGAVLTPLSKGDAVLPTEQTSNIWEWSKFNPEEYASKLLQTVGNVGGGNVQTNTMQVGALVQVNGNVNDSEAMLQIAAQQASAKIKQSFNLLSNGLNK